MARESTRDGTRSQFEEARRSIKAKIAEEEEKLRALDIAESIINGTQAQNGNNIISPEAQTVNPASSSTNAVIPSERGKKRFKITPEVRQAISGAGDKFSQQDISEIIEQKYPDVEVHRGSVSNALARMRSRGEMIDGHYLELVEEGGGSAPHVYMKVKGTNTSNEQEANDSEMQDASVEKGASVSAEDVEVDFNEQDFDDIPF